MDKKEKSLPSMSINWYPGHMAKTKSQIEEDLKLVDVVIELLDARIPNSSHNPVIAQLTKNKKKIIVLNKGDLAQEEENRKWIEYFKKQNQPAVVTDSNTGKGIEQIKKEIEKVMQEELERAKLKGIKNKTIRVMILGIPNVGKSSFINRMAKRNSAGVGNKPGFTKQKQWIRLSNNIELLDTPGVLWPKLEPEELALNLAYTGTIKEEILDKVEISFSLLKYLYQYHRKILMERYKIQNEEINAIKSKEINEEVLKLMNLIGKKRGAIIAGGNIDEEKVASIILEDFKSGKIGRITLEIVK